MAIIPFRPIPHSSSDPDRLPDAHRRLRDALTQGGQRPNTELARERDLAYFQAWCEASALPFSYPMPVAVLERFVLDHIAGASPAVLQALVRDGWRRSTEPYKLTTIRRILSSLGREHRLRDLPNPATNSSFKELLKAIRRNRTIDTTPHGKAALRRDLLDALLDTCDLSPRGVRDRAFLLVGFASGGRRTDETAGLDLEDLQEVWLDDGARGKARAYRWHVPYAKHDPSGEGFDVPIKGRAASALFELIQTLAAQGITSGAVFRQVSRRGRFLGRISTSGVRSWLIKRRAREAGLDPAAFSGHSLRSGWQTQAAVDDVHPHAAMALSQHKDPKTAQTYHRPVDIFDNPGSDLGG